MNGGGQSASGFKGRGAWVEHQEADVRPVANRGVSADDTARFLRELHQLRNDAGLGHAELAARAHFPYDSIRAAEVGPSLPDLPVLCAFVRGCGGTPEEWEERWRSLTRSPSLPVSATRQSGQSDAATAGARINSATQPGDGPDPSIIIAALSRVAEEMASPSTPSMPDFTVPPAAPDEPAAGARQAGWDPIRVSAAWPALAHTSMIPEPARAADVPGGVGAPWEATARATAAAPPLPPNPGTAGAGAAGPHVADAPGIGGRTGTSTRAANGTPVSVSGRGAVDRASAVRSPRTVIVAVAVILLCALAVLLAVFA